MKEVTYNPKYDELYAPQVSSIVGQIIKSKLELIYVNIKCLVFVLVSVLFYANKKIIALNE